MKRLFRLSVLSLALCFSMVFLSGCESTPQIGDEVKDGVTIAVTNNTGQDITSIAIKSTSDKNYPSVLSQEESLANEKPAELHAANFQSADIKVTCGNDTVYELHNINLADVKDATIALDGNVPYLAYTSIESGKSVSSLDDEKAYIKAQEEAAKKAEEEAAAKKAEEEAAKKAAAEKAAKEKAAKEKAAKEKAAKKAAAAEKAKSSSKSSSSSSKSSKSNSGSNSSGSKSSNSSSQSGSSSSGSNGGGEDCVDDLVLNE